MKELPYFRWFPKDAETDEIYVSMSDEELGFYHRCLNFSWINNGIPAEPGARARALRRNRKQADARWTDRVASCFKPHERRAGYLINVRQETERTLAEQKSIKAAESANARYERTATSDANALHARAPVESDSVPAPVLVVDSKKESSLPILDDFGRFVEICQTAELPASEADLRAAKFEWRQLDFQQKLDAVAGLKDRIAGGELSDPGFRPLPQNYLKNRIWQRPVRVQQANGKSRMDKTMEILHRNLSIEGKI